MLMRILLRDLCWIYERSDQQNEAAEFFRNAFYQWTHVAGM